MSVDTVSMTGWGRTAPTTALRFRPRTYEEAVAAVRGCGPRGVVARGLGRAHGDAAQNAGGSVVDMTALDRIRTFDADTGTVVCDAGVSLHRLMTVLLPLGWFVPVTPGPATSPSAGRSAPTSTAATTRPPAPSRGM